DARIACVAVDRVVRVAEVLAHAVGVDDAVVRGAAAGDVVLAEVAPQRVAGRVALDVVVAAVAVHGVRPAAAAAAATSTWSSAPLRPTPCSASPSRRSVRIHWPPAFFCRSMIALS